ncbi:MAG TPA: hypothetical protein VKU00_05535 [Chthonomonadaceae bacterium]|nr:hypothetical protein [Chthonomonadaceae bacterium]
MPLPFYFVRFSAKRYRGPYALLVWLCLLVALLAPAHAFGQAATAPSPTGRTPRLLWTPQRQAVWNRMVAEKNPWWIKLKGWADGSVPRYGDIGDYGTIAYQMTGDVKYAQRAWSKVEPWIQAKKLPYMNLNETREDFISYVWMYDWLYPALNPAQRTAYINWLNWISDIVLGKAPDCPWGNTRLGDCDVTIGHYFGLAFMDLATGPDNPRAGTFLNATWREPTANAPLNVGGLTATGSNRQTMRNAVSHYVEMDKGGVGVESSDYNLGTMKLLIIGAEGVRTATGKDYFPEITAFLPQLALAHLYQHTPDGNGSYQWGDVEHDRQLWIPIRVTLTGMLAGLTQNNPAVGPYLQKLTQEQTQWKGEYGFGSSPFSRFWLFYNPYAPAADWRNVLPKGYVAFGRGIQYLHDGWSPNSSLFGSHMSPVSNEDHEIGYIGDYQLYRHGEWAITHPIGYFETNLLGSMAVNGMVFAGMGAMREARGPVASEVDPQGAYAYQVGTTGGQVVRERYYDPPATFLHEWTRSILYLPSNDKLSDTIVIFDRTNAENPAKLNGFNRYYPPEKQAINGAPALKQWVIHAPVQPTLTTNMISWKTAGGQNVRVNTLLPEAHDRRAYDEQKIPFPVYVHKEELHWQVRIAPTTEQQWDTFLNVVQVYDNGPQLTNTLIKSSAGEAVEGTLISRSHHNDVLALFSARNSGTAPETVAPNHAAVYNPNMFKLLAAASSLEAGYTVHWTATTAQTDLYLANLDGNGGWMVSVDNKAAVPLTVSNQGLGRMHVSGAGAHSIRLSRK